MLGLKILSDDRIITQDQLKKKLYYFIFLALDVCLLEHTHIFLVTHSLSLSLSILHSHTHTRVREDHVGHPAVFKMENFHRKHAKNKNFYKRKLEESGIRLYLRNTYIPI